MKHRVEILNKAAGIYCVRVKWLLGVSFISTTVYILNTASKKGILVIDAGGRGSGRIITDAIKEAGLCPGDIRGIALSHWHKDHTGGVSELLSIASAHGASDIKVFIHKNDSVYFPGGRGAFIRFHPFLKIPMYHSPGKIPSADQCEFVVLDHTSGVNPLADWGLEFIHVPGHTPGSIAFYHSETESLFSGCGLAMIDRSRAGILPVFSDREEQVRSAQRLMRMDYRFLYPMHLHVRKDPIPMENRIWLSARSVMERIRGILPLFRYR
jgi:glyoxylase-like metal-dependent hydrolase (beta-lactamase superfamily II)